MLACAQRLWRRIARRRADKREVIQVPEAEQSKEAVQQSREAVQEDAFKARLVRAVESLQPGVVPVSEEHEAVIAEYDHIKDQLDGPTFGPLAPKITRYERDDGIVRIYGANLASATVVKVAGTRLTRAGFRFKDGEQPYIEADVPREAIVGRVTVFGSGGLATGQFDDAQERSQFDVAPGRQTPREKGGAAPDEPK
jgi:hypothetical protein